MYLRSFQCVGDYLFPLKLYLRKLKSFLRQIDDFFLFGRSLFIDRNPSLKFENRLVYTCFNHRKKIEDQVNTHCQTSSITAKFLSSKIGDKVSETNEAIHCSHDYDFIEIHVFAEKGIFLELEDANCHNLNQNSESQSDNLNRKLILIHY